MDAIKNLPREVKWTVTSAWVTIITTTATDSGHTVYKYWPLTEDTFPYNGNLPTHNYTNATGLDDAYIAIITVRFTKEDEVVGVA